MFFRAGILGYMEEVREDKIGSVLAWLQAGARGKASRMAFKKLQVRENRFCISVYFYCTVITGSVHMHWIIVTGSVQLYCTVQ